MSHSIARWFGSLAPIVAPQYAPCDPEGLVLWGRLALATGGAGGLRFRRLIGTLAHSDAPEVESWLEQVFAQNHSPWVYWLRLQRSLRSLTLVPTVPAVAY